jgi:hypothetical protein
MASSVRTLIGPLAMVTGALFILAQLVQKLTFVEGDRAATISSPWFGGAQIVYFAGFGLLMLTLIGLYAVQADRAGRFGLIAFVAAVAGTMALAGDLWFDAFAGPWIVANEPDLANNAGGSLMAGAFAGYVLFAVGWALFGLASLRARVFPALLSVALVIGGGAGFFALMAPYGIPLGIAIFALGAWLTWAARPRYARSPVAA